jgi:hypothetical protein
MLTGVGIRGVPLLAGWAFNRGLAEREGELLEAGVNDTLLAGAGELREVGAVTLPGEVAGDVALVSCVACCVAVVTMVVFCVVGCVPAGILRVRIVIL